MGRAICPAVLECIIGSRDEIVYMFKQLTDKPRLIS